MSPKTPGFPVAQFQGIRGALFGQWELRASEKRDFHQDATAIPGYSGSQGSRGKTSEGSGGGALLGRINPWEISRKFLETQPQVLE